MLNIIICSRTKTISSGLSKNIRNTVGCDYELIVINNSENKYSIFEAYNLGIVKSKGSFLCFIHDDILFHTKNWGIVIEQILKSNSTIGLIGIAGAKIKTKMPSAWWDCEDCYKRMSLVQHYTNGAIQDCEVGWVNSRLEEVVAIDGVFMVSKKTDNIKFNEDLKGFHNYDLNLSFEYLKKGFKVVVTKDILIEHFSIGKLDETWYKSTLQIHEIYKKTLPLSTISKYDFKKQEFKNGIQFITNLLDFKLKKQAFKIWLRLIWIKPKSKFHFEFIKLFLK
jgi:glycosyltransferase involved in cell wall biosynthesis